MLKLTIKQLLWSSVHIGDKKEFVNTQIKPYLGGYKSQLHFIQLSFTVVQFKLVRNILINLTSRRQKILVVNELDVFNLTKFLNIKNIFYYKNL